MITVDTLTQLIAQLLPEPHAGLLAGMLFGVKATMDKNFYEALIQTGTLHIVALSGTNITIMIWLIETSLLLLISRRIVSLLSILIIIGFILFVGPSPSVVRAAIMGSLVLFARTIGRQVWALWSWVIAVCTMLAFQPILITDISFQLSVGATLGMILFGSTTSSRLRHISTLRDVRNAIKQSLSSSFHLTLSAQIFTIPIILFHFHRISLISPLPNVLIGFLLPAITAIGFITIFLGLLWFPLGQIAAWIIWLPLEYVIRVIDWTSKIPLASVGW